jgi:xanthosine utilization system XapX-like protein
MLVLAYVEVTAPAPAPVVVVALVGLLGFVSLEGHK